MYDVYDADAKDEVVVSVRKAMRLRLDARRRVNVMDVRQSNRIFRAALWCVAAVAVVVVDAVVAPVVINVAGVVGVAVAAADGDDVRDRKRNYCRRLANVDVAVVGAGAGALAAIRRRQRPNSNWDRCR